ncbi:MAG: hypothetical protein HRT35_29120 [Algicola sp.]|nr:hypothetical protein [Algicola sp.]
MTDDPKIEFLAYQKPALESGRAFRLELTQTITPDNASGRQQFPLETSPPQSLKFEVQGERFALNPNAVHAMFPPAGSFGHFSDCLPHISLNRSTFAWERSAYGSDDFEPWLALLLFDEQEFEDGQVKQSQITLKDLLVAPTEETDQADQADQAEQRLDITLESGQKPDDKVMVIDVQQALLKKIMPSGDALKLQAHVRKRTDDSQGTATVLSELAVIIGNRLPKAGSASVVHLVSVEARFNNDNGFKFTDDDEQMIRLVSLKNWGFSAEAENGKTFETLVQSIDSGILRLPPENDDAVENDNAVDDDNIAEKFLANGYVALPHKLRQCDTTYSWYRGPLAPQQVERQFRLAQADKLPAFADALTRYHQDIGMFDVSYSAAYELGRSLALEDQIFSADLYRWKHQFNENICDQLQHAIPEPLQQIKLAQLLITTTVATNEEDPLAEKIKRWLAQLANLVDIPFNYLVPDEAMLGLYTMDLDEKILSPHTIRFFKLDQRWIESLLMGAFSIGGPLRIRTDEDGEKVNEEVKVFNDFTATALDQVKSGFLIRSALVSDYPDLQVDGYGTPIDNSEALKQDNSDDLLTVIRQQRLGGDVLFCLFEGDIATTELYLKPEGLHYGLDEEADSSGQIKCKKELKTESLYNAVIANLPELTPIITSLETIKQKVRDKELFYEAGLDDPADDGGKFEFEVNFKPDAALKPDEELKRVVDIAVMSDSLNGIVDEMAQQMIGTDSLALLEKIKEQSSAQFAMHMVEGSNKGRFVITPQMENTDE